MAARRASVGTLELDINRARWNFQHKCIVDGESSLKNNDIEGATELCNKALEHDKNFFPALELKKRIEHCKRVVEANAQASLSGPPALVSDDSDSSTEESDSDDTSVEVTSKNVKFSDNMHPKGVLKRSDSTNSKSKSASSDPRKVPHVHSDSCNAKLQSEKELRRILIKAHGRMITPTELLENLGGCCGTSDGDFQCPAAKCVRSFDKASPMLSHYVRRHFSVFNDREMKPFICKTCSKAYAEGNELCVHATIEHPKCKWLPRFKSLLQK